MKVELFLNTGRINPTSLPRIFLYAWHESIKSFDEDISILSREMPTNDCDVAVIYGYAGKNVRKQILKVQNRRKIINHQKKIGKHVICFDSRLFTNLGNTDYHKIALDSPMFNGNFINQNSPPDRWEMMQSKYSIPYKPWRSDGNYILICMQPTINWSMDGVDAVKWASNSIKKIQEKTDRPIYIKAHPSAPADSRRLQKLHPDVKIIPTSRSNFIEAIEDAYCLVVYNSNVATDAAVYGVPVFAAENRCMAWPVANKTLDNIENPEKPNRDQWLYDLGYAQWSEEEVRNGTVWRRFRNYILNQ